jgi:putative ABC transport system permease protein
MLYNYFIVAWRSLLRNRLTTVVNLAGLVTGITATLLIMLFILDELKYDQHFKNKDRIYRVSSVYNHTGSTYHTAQTDAFLAQRLVQQLPEFEHVTRILPADEAFLFLESKAFKEIILYRFKFHAGI